MELIENRKKLPKASFNKAPLGLEKQECLLCLQKWNLIGSRHEQLDFDLLLQKKKKKMILTIRTGLKFN